MTGANRFTRAAGLTGLLSAVVLLLAFVAGMAFAATRPGHDDDMPVALVLLFVVMAGVAVTVFAGLLVRHRAYAWVWLPAALFAAAVVTYLVAGSAAADVVGLAAVAALLVGVIAADDLPRVDASFALVGIAAKALGDDDSLFVGLLRLVGSAGWLGLCYAMWREPLPDRAPYDATPSPV